MDELYYGRGKDCDNSRMIDFINEVFFGDDENNTEFLKLLPKIYKDKYRPAYNNFVVQDADGTFRSAIGNFYNDMTVGGIDLKTCCIGNVAVGAEYRSMGYMKKLMEMSVEDMKNNGTALSYLGGQRQRYGYFGYENSGVCYNFVFSRNSYKHSLRNMAGGLSFEKLTEDDKELYDFIDGIYAKQPVISRRPKDAYYDILCSWCDIPYIVRENGTPVGYAVLSTDNKNISEFGLADNALLPRFIASLFETFDVREFHFDIAPFETEKAAFFTRTASGMDIGGSESILVFDYKTVITAFLRAKAAYTTLCDGEMTVLIHGVKGDEKLKISVINNTVNVENTEDTAQAEFDCHEAVRAFFSIYPTDRAKLSPQAQSWLPLPMYFSSRDTM